MKGGGRIEYELKRAATPPSRKVRKKKHGMTRAMKRYLFWRPPSPPRSSEKFLRFHQQQLNHREKRHSPISGEKERRGRATERESDSPLFSPLHLMATNLIMCLHSEAAETCSLTYTPPFLFLSLCLCHAYTHTYTSTLPPFAITLPFTELSSAQMQKGRALVS